MFNTGIARFLGINGWIDQFFAKRKKKRETDLLEKQLEADRIAVAKRKKQKIFAIGFNKTGTTSVHHALKEFDIIVGHQNTAEWLLDDMIAGNYEALYDYCETAEAFQDVPFSYPGFYKLLDEKYPNSKFILTQRDNEEQWYKSLVKFHANLYGNGSLPTAEELENAVYIYKGSPKKTLDFIFGRSDYDPETYKKSYKTHNQEVLEYFKDRPDDLLVINVSESNSYKQLCEFIGQKALREKFEWRNKTSEMSIK